MKSLITIVILALLSFTACNNTENHEQNHKEHQKEAKEQHDDHADHADHNEQKAAETLHLNNGKKWIANQATQDGMDKIQNLLNDYIKTKGTDHVALGEAMAKETSSIIQQCDMVGEDHDQLHVVLVPILNAVKAIKTSDSEEPLEELQHQLKEYFTHFETAK